MMQSVKYTPYAPASASSAISAHESAARARSIVESASRRPRVLLVGPFPPVKGGVTTFMLNLMASPLRAEFVFVSFTTARPPKLNVVDNWGYGSMLRGGSKRVIAGVLITLWHFLTFPFVVLRKRIDLVQIQASDYQVFWEAVAYAAMARLLRRKVLFRIGGAFDIFHGGAGKFEKSLIAAALRLPHAVIAQSTLAHDYLRKAGRDGQMILLPNWLGELGPEPVRDPGGSPATCLFIAGNEALRKGIEEVLAAAQMLMAERCPVRFHLIAMTPASMARVTAAGLDNVAAMEGPVGHDRVQQLMRSCDIFLLPSHGEGFPNSLVEAMGAGMAAIATPVGAVPEMATGDTVRLVPLGDAAALAAAIRDFATDAALRHGFGHRARATVRAQYTAAAALPNLSATYRQLLAEAGVR